MKTPTKAEQKAVRKEIWIDQIKTAIYMADEAIRKNPEDNGTCNFDMVMIEKEPWFTYAEIIDMFKQCGIKGACKASEYSRHYTKMIALPNYVGQADKNTRWAETFKYWLQEQGFKCSMYYQCD